MEREGGGPLPIFVSCRNEIGGRKGRVSTATQGSAGELHGKQKRGGRRIKTVCLKMRGVAWGSVSFASVREKKGRGTGKGRSIILACFPAGQKGGTILARQIDHALLVERPERRRVGKRGEKREKGPIPFPKYTIKRKKLDGQGKRDCTP